MGVLLTGCLARRAPLEQDPQSQAADDQKQDADDGDHWKEQTSVISMFKHKCGTNLASLLQRNTENTFKSYQGCFFSTEQSAQTART